MPPKKNATKSGEVVTNSDETSLKKQKSAKPTMKNPVEASSRTLRPRKTPTATEPVKTTKATKTKKDPNVVTSSKKKEAVKGKRKKIEENSEEGEPAEKLVKNEEEQEQDNNVSATSIFDFKANTIQGEEVSLSKYKGHVCIIVNVASKCGYTSSNYKEFVELYDKYGEDKGLKILAFPCNQFSNQEPGNNSKICEFAKKKNVDFDMFEKIDVNGKDAHPLWKYLTGQREGPKGAKIDWNFTKFLINKDGQVVERFKSTVKPLALINELEKLW